MMYTVRLHNNNNNNNNNNSDNDNLFKNIKPIPFTRKNTNKKCKNYW